MFLIKSPDCGEFVDALVPQSQKPRPALSLIIEFIRPFTGLLMRVRKALHWSVTQKASEPE